MRPEEYSALIYSPQWCSLLLGHFLSGFQSQKAEGTPIPFSLLALPVSFNNKLFTNLSNLNTRSTLDSFLEKKENRIWIKGVGLLLPDYRHISLSALVYLAKVQALKVDDTIRLSSPASYTHAASRYRSYCKAAHMWGSICGKEDISSLIWKLEIPHNELHY